MSLPTTTTSTTEVRSIRTLLEQCGQDFLYAGGFLTLFLPAFTTFALSAIELELPTLPSRIFYSTTTLALVAATVFACMVSARIGAFNPKIEPFALYLVFVASSVRAPRLQPVDGECLALIASVMAVWTLTIWNFLLRTLEMGSRMVGTKVVGNMFKVVGTAFILLGTLADIVFGGTCADGGARVEEDVRIVEEGSAGCPPAYSPDCSKSPLPIPDKTYSL
ncbi:hypothetical protein C8R44DRAFT_773571 [Mycena epipterygia]|nr:hypothetical protein C8R44DRAFT_773571 [Mycena epipterygia]